MTVKYDFSAVSYDELRNVILGAIYRHYKATEQRFLAGYKVDNQETVDTVCDVLRAGCIHMSMEDALALIAELNKKDWMERFEATMRPRQVYPPIEVQRKTREFTPDWIRGPGDRE